MRYSVGSCDVLILAMTRFATMYMETGLYYSHHVYVYVRVRVRVYVYVYVTLPESIELVGCTLLRYHCVTNVC